MFRRSFLLALLLVGLSGAGATLALPSADELKAREERTQPRRGASAPKASRAETTTAPARSSTTIVIDAGHGGFDRGGIPRQRVSEKAMTLDVSQRLRAILQASGYRVVMTRNSDVFIPLGTRVAIANSYRDAIFVSVHFNSATRRGANGIETYFYSRQSMRLASSIHYHVAGGAPSMNRGLRRRGFYVLRRTRIPAVLVECGFLTNPTEAARIQSSSYRQLLAEQIARGVRSRGSVGSDAGVASTQASVPLQPFQDQTRIRRSSSKRYSKRKKSSKSKAKSKSSKSKKSSATSSEKKTSTATGE